MLTQRGAWQPPRAWRVPAGEESLTIFVDKRKLSRRAEPAGAGNSSAVSLETLHQLAASYFIDRESTLRRLHHIQIATAAIKVGEGAREGTAGGGLVARRGQSEVWPTRVIYGKSGALMKARFSAGLPAVDKAISRQLFLLSELLPQRLAS